MFCGEEGTGRGDSSGAEKRLGEIGLSEKELQYQALFRSFCHAITIEGRRNAELQRNMLPLRFREYMFEFQ